MATWGSSAKAEDRTSSQRARITLAFIEPEIIGDLPQAQRKSLSAWLDMALAETFAQQRGILLVDRQSLNKVLGEHISQAAGIAKVDPAKLEAGIRPLWSAGVLISSKIDAKTGAVVIEAISAQTGLLLASIYAQGTIASVDDAVKLIQPRLASFSAAISPAVANLQSKPLLEISGKIASGSRLTWMVDDLTESAGARLAADSPVILLVPRQPLLTKEERILRVMGLAEARPGDAVAGLSPVPQFRLSFELTDSAKTGISYDKTPIRLTLKLYRKDLQPLETQIDGEVGQWESCRSAATKWLISQLKAANGAAPMTGADETSRTKQLAAETLWAVSQWTALGYHRQGTLDQTIRARVARHCLRAAHLDPSSEQAAFLAACFVDALYPREDTNLSLLAIDRAIVETQRYIDRFKQANVEHHREMLHQLGGLGVHGAWKVNNGPGREDAIVRPPNAQLYPYNSVVARSWADYGYLGYVDQRYNNSNSFAAFSFYLLNKLIPCIPEDKLDEEYQYWRAFYAVQVAKVMKEYQPKDFLNNRPAPWELIDAAFQARKRNPAAVRNDLQELARQFPQNVAHLWGGAEGIAERMPLLLQAAGDPDWKTWRPAFTAAKEINVGFYEMTGFLSNLAGPTLFPWDLKQAARIPAVPVVIPESVNETGRASGSLLGWVEGLFVASNDIWLITPGSSLGSFRQRNRLFVAELNPVSNGELSVSPVEIPWPEQDAHGKPTPADAPIFQTSYVTESANKTTVWIGTQSNGLARFDKVGGRWTSRWYTENDGLPGNSISRIASCRRGSQRLILLISLATGATYMPDGTSKTDRPTYVYTLNPDTNEVRLIFDATGSKEPFITSPVGITREGKAYLLEFLGRDGYDLDIDQVQRVEASGIWNQTHDLIRDAQGTFRLFDMAWGGPSDVFDNLFERSLDTIKPLPDYSMQNGGTCSVFPFPEIGRCFGRVWWTHSEGNIPLTGNSPTVKGEYFTSSSAWYWIGFTNERVTDSSYWVIAYKPAPRSSANWAAEDQWAGPLRLPDDGCVSRMARYGKDKLLLTTRCGVYVVDCRQAIEQAAREGKTCSTEQWRSQFDKRLRSADFRSILPSLIETKQWDQAARLLESTGKGMPATLPIGDKSKRHLGLWSAHLLARKGDLPAAVSLYGQIAADAAMDADHPAEVFARMNQIMCLYKASRFQDMLDACKVVNERFPQTIPDVRNDELNVYVRDAEAKLKSQAKSEARN